MRIASRPIGGSQLVRDYLLELPRALAFYTGSPFDLTSYRRKLAEVERRFDEVSRSAAAAALTPTSTAAADRLRRFVEEGGVMVTTGQQTGFLTGPLYTILKALSAATLARHLERRLGVLVLPVFWAASEDHDWAEVNHADLLGTSGRLRRFTLPGGDDRPLPMSARRLDGDLDAVCDEVVHHVGGKSLDADQIKRIVDPYRERGQTVAGAFIEAITPLLARWDFLVADAAGERLKEASRGILRVALADAGPHEAALAARTAALEEAGYTTQVKILERGTNVFEHGEEGRLRLYLRGGGYGARERRGVMEEAELLARVEGEPGRFSPNVLLRPVVESHVFPTVAYVGGPGELGYFAQAGALFEQVGVLGPVAVPRYSATIVERRVEGALEELALTEAELVEPREVLRDRLARREFPAAAAAELAGLRAEVVRRYESLAEAVEEVDRTLTGPLGRIRNRTLLEARRAERKVVRAIKRREEDRMERLDRILEALRPRGGPQDRVLNVLSFLGRYGEEVLTRLEAAIEAEWRLPEGG